MKARACLAPHTQTFLFLRCAARRRVIGGLLVSSLVVWVRVDVAPRRRLGALLVLVAVRVIGVWVREYIRGAKHRGEEHEAAPQQEHAHGRHAEDRSR